MSRNAKNFLRLRYWLEGKDGGEFRSLSSYEVLMAQRLRWEATLLIAGDA